MKIKMLATALALGLSVPAFAANMQAGSAPEGRFFQAFGQNVERVETIRRVQPIVGRVEMHRTVGARVYLRPDAGLNAPYLQRLVDRDLASGAAAGDPLAVQGARATVKQAGQHFVVEIEAPTRAGGQQVAELARSVTGR